MKKLSLLTLITFVYTFNLYSFDEQNPGFRIDGLNEVMADVASQAFTHAAKELKDSTIPALESAIKNSLNEAKRPLKGAVKEALVEAAPPILLSTAGLIITSAGIMLMYQGLKADSEQENNTEKKVNTTKLFGYGAGLIVIGVATMMHMSIRHVFNGSKV